MISSKVPAEIRNRLSEVLVQALQDPDVVQKLANSHMQAVGNTPAEFRAYMDEELKRWEPLIRDLGITQNKN